MRELLHRIPQLQRLAVFDAAAGAASFSAAGRALGMSQPAVSRHIAILERQLRCVLFDRSASATTLTDRGRLLAEVVDEAFALLERRLSTLPLAAEPVVIAAQPALATSVLIPELAELSAALGSEIRLHIFDRAAEVDPRRVDAAIAPGRGPLAGMEGVKLFDEAARPVCSPELAATFALDEDTPPDVLAACPLLAIDDRDRPSMTWEDWFAAAGSPRRPATTGVVYDRYPTIVQEALVGRGVILGWRHLTSDLLERGMLVPVGSMIDHADVGHFLCWPPGRGDEPPIAALRDWLSHRFDGRGLVAG